MVGAYGEVYGLPAPYRAWVSQGMVLHAAAHHQSPDSSDVASKSKAEDLVIRGLLETDSNVTPDA
jgi:hypothetical protein